MNDNERQVDDQIRLNIDIHLCRKMLELKARKYILPVEVVDPKDNVELNVEFKLSILPP